MNVVDILHNKAMEFADEAIIAKHKGSMTTAKEFYLKAFHLEKEAALRIPVQNVDLLPRHVLIRSAASLAMLSEQFGEAEKLILLGLSSSPPDFIKEELSDIAKEVEKRKKQTIKTQFIELMGLFIYANASENEIKIQDTKQPSLYTLIAPATLIKEIVQQHFLEQVAIKASVSAGGVLLIQEMRKVA